MVFSSTFVGTVTSKKYYIRGNFASNSTNVIYLVECINCKYQYVGSATSFKQRFQRSLWDCQADSNFVIKQVLLLEDSFVLVVIYIYMYICMYALCMYMYRLANLPKNQTIPSSAEIARTKKSFQHPLLTKKPATMTENAQTTIPPNHHKALRLSRSKIKW